MAISVGDKIPDVEVKVLNAEGMPEGVQTSEVLGNGRVVLFGVPGAFTPGCTKIHLPGYVQSAEKLAQKGVDKVVCVAVNDAWVMDAWRESQGVGDKVQMLADGNGLFAEAMGLGFDGAGYGLGNRNRRYAAVIENGTITRLEVEEGGGVTVSSCENILSGL
jgi:glutaredoxin/glutathione-dependent peroxiredoxin